MTDQDKKHEKLKKFLEKIRQSSQSLNEIHEINKRSNENDISNTNEKGQKLKKFLENLTISKSCDNSYTDIFEFEIPTKKEISYRILPAGISSPQFPRKH